MIARELPLRPARHSSEPSQGFRLPNFPQPDFRPAAQGHFTISGVEGTAGFVFRTSSRPLVQSPDDRVDPGFTGAGEFCHAVPLSGVEVQIIDQFAKFFTRFEEGSPLRWHFDSGSGYWIASDAPSSLARVEASESADLNLVPGSQSTDDAAKYGADDNVGSLPGHPNGVVNLFSQISPGHLAL